MPGTLYIVATPIGNLADLSARALEVLKSVDLVACEDTRTSRTLLARYGVAAPTVALHRHNERAAAAKLLGVLREGRAVALVSDAGTPAVSDPGALLVEAAHREGIRVVPVPGPSASIAALSASGFASGRFYFAGFLPASRGERRKALAGLPSDCPVVVYEAPHRVAETVEDLVGHFGAGHALVVARELTKKFEEIARMTLGEARAWLEAGAHRQQGEFVLVLGPAEAQPAGSVAEGERVLSLLLDSLPASDAARLAARISGAPRKALYRMALERRRRPRSQ